ncbi:MAG: hypothetical protein J6X60_00040 [Ruminiclostridium sp.]|nr:hypothetical protein [Ruminiclostridium sp.]
MTDILPDIAELLGNTAPVELGWPDRERIFPCIILSEIGNEASVILSGADRYSVITLQTDIYAEDERETRALAISVNDILTGKGIKRSFSEFITDEDKPRMCMRYRFGIDEVTGRIVAL